MIKKKNKREPKIEDLKFDLGQWINAKASLEIEIDVEQKFLSALHLELGKEQTAYFVEKIRYLQSEYSLALLNIQKLKQKISEYETKANK